MTIITSDKKKNYCYNSNNFQSISINFSNQNFSKRYVKTYLCNVNEFILSVMFSSLLIPFCTCSHTLNILREM